MQLSAAFINFQHHLISFRSSSSCLCLLHLPVTSIFPVSFFQQHILEGSSYTRCDQTSYLYFVLLYEGHIESKERFAIKKYLLIIGKKKNMQVSSHTFTYFST
jgi:hypothetical protein